MDLSSSLSPPKKSTLDRMGTAEVLASDREAAKAEEEALVAARLAAEAAAEEAAARVAQSAAKQVTSAEAARLAARAAAKETRQGAVLNHVWAIGDIRARPRRSTLAPREHRCEKV